MGKSFLLFVLFKKYLSESGIDNDHIIEIALDGIENEEMRDTKKCYLYIKDGKKYYSYTSKREPSKFDRTNREKKKKAY